MQRRFTCFFCVLETQKSTPNPDLDPKIKCLFLICNLNAQMPRRDLLSYHSSNRISMICCM
ncbi:DNA replication complex GINS protein PSF1, partial [Clarias magur]